MDNLMKIDKIARLTNETDLLLIQDFLDLSKEAILCRCFPFENDHHVDIPTKYDHLQIMICTDMVVQKRKRTAISVPSHLLNHVVPYMKIF